MLKRDINLSKSWAFNKRKSQQQLCINKLNEIFGSLIMPTKGQEYPDFCHPGTSVSFPDDTATSSGTSGNGPVGPENSVWSVVFKFYFRSFLSILTNKAVKV